MPALRNLTGVRFGKLVGVKRLPEKCRFNRTIWLFQCDCGATAERSLSTVLGNIWRGSLSSCGCVKSLCRLRPYESTYNSIRCCARYRKQEFSITYEEFLKIIEPNKCTYCGSAQQWIEYKKTGRPLIGIDRIDNTKGYISGNCVTCCTICNQAKNSRTLEVFYTWVERAYKHLKEKKLVN